MEQLSNKKRKANKEHICDWCSLKINKGEIYANQSNADEGTVFTWKNHIHCADLMDKIGAYDNGDGVSTDDFQEYAKNEYQNIMSKYHNEVYESKDFKYPNFEQQLKFVLEFHKIMSPQQLEGISI
ncbi:MAG: hypothetical protein Q7W13_13160 [Bacteroidia bacterium]|nr:hypothetical protein [Bacteroidia bacterium]